MELRTKADRIYIMMDRKSEDYALVKTGKSADTLYNRMHSYKTGNPWLIFLAVCEIRKRQTLSNVEGLFHRFCEENFTPICGEWYLVEGKEWYKELTKDLGINEIHNWTDRNQITKVVLYYLDKNNKYYVPVTKYSNDQREKIKIIIEELKKTEEHLISLENIHTELLDYKEEANVLFLNFNSYLIDENTNSQEKLLNTIAYSVFASYDVNMVMFEINHKKLKYVARNNKIN